MGSGRKHVPAAGLGLLVAAGIAVAALSPDDQAQAPNFEVDPFWPKPLPGNWLLGSVMGVAVDARDHVFVVHRMDSFNARTETGATSDPPIAECCASAPAVLEFDPEGNLAGSWGGPGQGYTWPAENHGIAVDPQGNIWIGGSGGTDTHLLKFARDGRFIAEVGRVASGGAAAGAGGGAGGDTATAGRAGRGGRGGRGRGRGAAPALPAASTSTDAFGGATRVSFDAGAGEAFVADGARNRRVAVVDINTGAIKRFWGAYGERPQDGDQTAYAPGGTPARQFGNPVACAQVSSDGMVYVCDRSNDRIQVFRTDGTFVTEKAILPRTLGDGSVWDIALSRDPQQRFLYVADGMNMKVHILDRQSLDVLATFGTGGRQPGQFSAVHSIAVDSNGNVYTGEAFEGKRVQRFNYRGMGPVTQANRGVLWPDTAR